MSLSTKQNNCTHALRRSDWILPILLPSLLIGLFYLTKDLPGFMEKVFRGLTVPIGNQLTKWTSSIPFSLGEALIVLLILWSILHILRGLWVPAEKKERLRGLLVRTVHVAGIGLWLWAGVSWLWNIGYFVPGISETLDLERGEISAEELEQTATKFADILDRYADDIRRDDSGLFDHAAEEFFPEAIRIYDHLEQEYPSLAIRDAMPKKLLFSKFQSYQGFSGFYFPFTGESNINTDIPRSSQPFTIAHEMAHQRFVASEDEANFLGIAACLSSDQPIYIYSGALAGLQMLASPLHEANPEAWKAVAETLPIEVATDWNYGIEYWNQFKTPLEEWSRDVYDTFLKSQGQELGIRSYGACVDLLVNYYSADTLVNPYSE